MDFQEIEVFGMIGSKTWATLFIFVKVTVSEVFKYLSLSLFIKAQKYMALFILVEDYVEEE